MKPAVGRIVHTFADPKLNNGAEIAPAIITRVWEGREPPYVNIRVVHDGSAAPYWKTSVHVYPDEQAARDAAGSSISGESSGGGLHAAFWPPRV